LHSTNTFPDRNFKSAVEKVKIYRAISALALMRSGCIIDLCFATETALLSKAMMKNFKFAVLAAAVATFLTACGGGGGSSSPAQVATPPVSTTPAAPAVTPADLQATVPALTYPAGSAQFAFVTAVNQFRQQVGLGLLAQNASLDTSTQNHLQYVLKNDVLTGGTVNMSANDPATGRSMYHIEAPANPLFTGVQELDRAKVAAYAGGYVGEEVTFGGGKGGQAAVDSLTGTIYHRAGLMLQGVRDIGVAAGSDASQTFVVDFGYNKAQSNASDFVGIYPADNQTSVGRFTRVETPNPFPDLSTSNTDFPTKTGYPISVVSKEGTTLQVINFTITEAGAAAPLDARQMTADNDPNRNLTSNVAFLVAKGTLKANTTYAVAFSGRVNNVLVNKTWSFTTGA
jgi:uncharacterized protein YkwD